MRITVTGSYGFLGSCVARAVESISGHELIKHDLEPNDFVAHSAKTRHIYGDLRRRDICENLVENTDVLIHMAQSNNPLQASSDWVGDLEQSLMSTMTLVDTARRTAHPLHIIYPSSGGTVYAANGDIDAYSESDACFSSSPYGIQKIMVENYLHLLPGQNPLVNVTVLRISNPYGILLPVDRKQGFIGVALNRIKHKLPVEIVGNPGNIRDYIHVDDLVRAFLAVLERTNSYEVFNIGSGIGCSVLEIIEIFKTLIHEEFPIQTGSGNSFAANSLPLRNVLDIGKAREQLDWAPEIKLSDGIKDMIGKYL